MRGDNGFATRRMGVVLEEENLDSGLCERTENLNHVIVVRNLASNLTISVSSEFKKKKIRVLAIGIHSLF